VTSERCEFIGRAQSTEECGFIRYMQGEPIGSEKEETLWQFSSGCRLLKTKTLVRSVICWCLNWHGRACTQIALSPSWAHAEALR
jgi:hypothetical protein